MIKQKIYIKDGYRLKYILEENNSEDLIIIFSSCTRPGIKARYNYNRTLKSVNANKLFILDDFGDDKRGVFYLGCNNDYKVQSIVKELIDDVIKRTSAKRITYVGSSKGGYAALNFGIDQNNSNIIIGAPQYYLGKYLNHEANRNTLKYVIGDIKSEKIKYLDEILYNKINNNKTNNVKIYIHYSENEHTYSEHIKFLLNDLDKNNFNYECEKCDYENHSDVSIYFPKYLTKTLKNILESRVG